MNGGNMRRVVYVDPQLSSISYIPIDDTAMDQMDGFWSAENEWVPFRVDRYRGRRGKGEGRFHTDISMLWWTSTGFLLNSRAAEKYRADPDPGGVLLAVTGVEMELLLVPSVADALVPGGYSEVGRPGSGALRDRFGRAEFVETRLPVRQFFTFRRPNYQPSGVFASSDDDGRFPSLVEGLMDGSFSGADVRPVWSSDGGPEEFLR